MFGSLVVVFPTPHEGGALVLRHDSKEWTFDSAQLTTGHDTPHIAYVAFYSDIEHEVMPVKSGYRVTVTYNLYFSPSPTAPMTVPSTVLSTNSVVESTFTAELKRLLADPEFVPEGGNLMFGLRHQYPVNVNNLGYRTDGKALLQALCAYLKESDAVVYRVCREHRLEAKLMPVFVMSGDGNPYVIIACDRVLNMFRWTTDSL